MHFNAAKPLLDDRQKIGNTSSRVPASPLPPPLKVPSIERGAHGDGMPSGLSLALRMRGFLTMRLAIQKLDSKDSDSGSANAGKDHGGD